MAKMLVQITHGPEDSTTAALGFLVAKTALEEGHEVSVFLAGNAARLLSDRGLKVDGRGTGIVGEHYEAIAANGGRFYLSGMLSKAQPLVENDIAGKPAELATPETLVRLAVESDKVITY